MLPWKRRSKRRKNRGHKACMECGSGRLDRVRMWDGPVTYEHNTFASHVCMDCGWSGIPVIFNTEEERQRFQDELEKNKKKGKGGRRDH